MFTALENAKQSARSGAEMGVVRRACRGPRGRRYLSAKALPSRFRHSVRPAMARRTRAQHVHQDPCRAPVRHMGSTTFSGPEEPRPAHCRRTS